MALAKQKVSIPLVMGLDTKTDEKQQSPGTLRVLENAVFDEPGKLKKRNGYLKVELKDIDNVNITNTKVLSNYKNELTLFNNKDMYSYASTVNQWSNKGQAFTIVPDSTQVIRTRNVQTTMDSVHSGGLDVFVYEDSTGVSLSVLDNESKAFLINKQVLSAVGSNPKVVNRDNTIYIFYMETTTLKWQKFDIYDFNNITAATTVITAQNNIYDVELVADRIQIGHNKTTSGGTLTFVSLKTDDTLASEVEVTGEFASVSISLAVDETSRLICSYYDGTDVKVISFNYTLGAKLIPETSVETIANVINTAIISTSLNNYTVVYEVSNADTFNYIVKKNTIDSLASIGTPSVVLRSVSLASKLWCHDSTCYFTALHDNNLQSTLFISDLDGQLVSKISSNTAGNVITAGGLPRVSQVSANKYLVASQVKGRLTQDNGTFFSILGVNSTILDFEPESLFDTISLGNNLHIAGGYLKMYDGAEIVEHGFHLFPEGLSDGGTSTSGGVLADGAYAYRAVYAWTDAQGLIHRSAPSLDFNVTLAGGGSTQQQTITIPTLRLTSKDDAIIELYRTEKDGIIFYLVSSTTAPTPNDKTVDSVDIVDNSITDAALISRETLYTTGDVLDNIAAPSSSIIESFKNRVFITTPESGKINYSKIQFEAVPVEFNDALEQVIPDQGGLNVALKTMDDKLIIFKEHSIYYLSGDGPNNLGEQDTFIEPELISSEIGCKNSSSVILTPSGIFFASNKGIYQLTRSLALQYIGAPVEDFNNLTISSAQTVADKNQIRFTTLDGECLVYNYIQQKWTTFANHRAISATTLNNDYYYLRSDNLLYKEDTSFTDNGTPVKMKLESGWLSFDGIQGFQRVYKMLILGEFKSNHKLRIRVAYDFVDAWVQESTIEVSDFINSTAYGLSSPYGAETTYGASNLYQIRLDFARQKCQSIKISIEDVQASHGEGMNLSNVLFVVGSKAVDAKISQTRTYGTS